VGPVGRYINERQTGPTLTRVRGDHLRQLWFPGLDTVVADSRDGDISAARLTPAAKVTKRRQLSRYRSQTRRLPVLGLLRASFRAAAMVWAEREARLGASPDGGGPRARAAAHFKTVTRVTTVGGATFLPWPAMERRFLANDHFSQRR